MPLETELRAYEERREELYRRYRGKYIVFHGHEFIGPFDTLDVAAHEAVRWRGPGPVLIRHVGADELQELVDRVTPENRHKEVDWGKPAGKEIW